MGAAREVMRAVGLAAFERGEPRNVPDYEDHRDRRSWLLGWETGAYRAEKAVAQELRNLERTLAYDMASSCIDSHCTSQYCDKSGRWVDLQTAITDVTDEVRYLHSRRLLDVTFRRGNWGIVASADYWQGELQVRLGCLGVHLAWATCDYSRQKGSFYWSGVRLFFGSGRTMRKVDAVESLLDCGTMWPHLDYEYLMEAGYAF